MHSLQSKIGNQKKREIIIGKSFAQNPNTGFHTFRYDFRPASIDCSKDAIIDVNENQNVIATLPQHKSHNTVVYKGPKRPATKECVLIFDHKTNTCTLERLNSHVNFKRVRPEADSNPEPSKKPKTAQDEDSTSPFEMPKSSSPIIKPISKKPSPKLNNHIAPPRATISPTFSMPNFAAPSSSTVSTVPQSVLETLSESSSGHSHSSSSSSSSDSESEDEHRTPPVNTELFLPSMPVFGGEQMTSHEPVYNNHTPRKNYPEYQSSPTHNVLNEDLELSESDDDDLCF